MVNIYEATGDENVEQEQRHDTLFEIYEDDEGVHTHVSDDVPASVIRDVLISHVLDIIVKETAATSAHMIKDTFTEIGKQMREMQDLQTGKKLIGV